MSLSLSPRRFWMINAGVSVLFLVILYQLVQLTVLRRNSLEALADKQHRLTVEIPPIRGLIQDRKGRELATNLKVPSIYAVPRLLSDKEKPLLAEKVGKILKLEPSVVLDRLTRDKAFIWLKRKVSYDQVKDISLLKNSAFGVLEEYKRFYPQGDLASQILGFADIDNQGLEGIELYHNRDLQGRAGKRYTKRDALGREVKAFEIKTIPARDGNKITLTIDQYLQYITERALDRAVTKWHAKGGMAIVMEPDTGRILVLANRPTFDPNKYEGSNADNRRNRAVTDMYEPGSVFKIVTASAALNENVVTTDRVFDCENGEYHYGSKTLHDVHSYGNLTFEEVIIKSSNIGTVKIGQLLAPEAFHRYVKAFGFGDITGIDMPGEASGYVRPPKEWSKTSPYNIPIGQEVMVTALQMTTAMAVVANGGNLVRPFIISKIEDPAGVVMRENKPVVRWRVIRPEVAETMRKILTRVVEEGTGKSAKIEGIPVGGKTGTAQKVLPNGRGYSHSNFVSSFVGFGPSEDPKLVMAVVVDDPHPSYYGGTVAAPVFKEVMETALLAVGTIPNDAEIYRPEAKSLAGLKQNQSMIEAGQGPGKALELPKSQPGM